MKVFSRALVLVLIFTMFLTITVFAVGEEPLTTATVSFETGPGNSVDI